MKLNTLDWIAIILMIIGSLNWGLIGVFGFSLVVAIFGADSIIARIIFSLVGFAAVYTLAFLIPRMTTKN